MNLSYDTYKKNNVNLPQIQKKDSVFVSYETIEWYKGACVLLFIDHNVLCVLLFKNSKTDIYTVPGGKAEYNEVPFSTASRECNEETVNTLNIMQEQIPEEIPEEIQDQTHENNKKRKQQEFNNFVFVNDYFCFFKRLNISYATIKNIFVNNKRLLLPNSPTCWHETNNISLFSIDSLLHGKQHFHGINNNKKIYACLNMFYEMKFVSERTINFIDYAIKKQIIHLKNNAWNTNLINNNVNISETNHEHFSNQISTIEIK